MPSPTEITVSQLSRLVGLPGAPVLIDVRTEREYAADPRLIPTAQRHDGRDVSDWAKQDAGRSIIVFCQRGAKFSQDAAAWLRHEGLEARSLEGGFEAWSADRQPLVCDLLLFASGGLFCAFDAMSAHYIAGPEISRIRYVAVSIDNNIYDSVILVTILFFALILSVGLTFLYEKVVAVREEWPGIHI